MALTELPKAIAAWLGTTKHNRICITKGNSNAYELKITCSKTKSENWDRKFAIIGDTWVAAPDGLLIEAADPEFFNKLEAVINKAEGYYL